MSTLWLYATTVAIWGTSWFAIRFQLGAVHPVASVGWRFLLAAAILFAWCALRGLKLRYPLRDHLYLALQGALLFSINHIVLYLAVGHVASGLAAVAFSTIVLFNIAFGALLLGTPVRLRLMLAGLVGLAGLALVFLREIAGFDAASGGTIGVALAVLGTAFASLGNMAAVRNQRAGIPVLQGNAWGMAYGGLVALAFVALAGLPAGFDPSPAYVGSMLYLAVVSSIIGFGAYLTLVGRIGADRAAYSSVLFPIVALGISTAFEGYAWTAEGAAGIVLILLGNVVALARSAPRPTAAQASCLRSASQP
jgi:drug/metabolite transporter (DMT)-like permease